MATYILIHGSWYGAWCWAPLEKELRAWGHVAKSSDLPGHGSDSTPPEEISFQTYMDSLISLLTAESGPVTLVGHSFGAVLAQSLADRIPDKVSQLIFIAGNVVPSGYSLKDVVVKDSLSLLGPEARIHDGLICRVREEAAIPALFNCCTAEVGQAAAARLCPEPVAPWEQRVFYGSAGYSDIRKFYVECTKDQAVTPSQQQHLRNSIDCDFVCFLDADHSPFLSCPVELAAVLDSSQENSRNFSSYWKSIGFTNHS